MSTKTKTRLRTVSSFVVSAMTVLTMSGVVYLAPVATNVANAAVPSVTIGGTVINDGDTIRATGTLDVYIVKLVGAKQFKRLVLNPSIFNSYGQLSWAKVKDVPASTVAAFTNSNLVQHVNAAGVVVDTKVWSVTSPANSDTGTKKWMNITGAQFSAAGLDWDSIYKINDTEAADTFYPTGSDVTATDNLSAWATNVNGASSTVVATAAGLSVALSGVDPATKVAAQNAQDVTFSTYTVSAGSSAKVKVDSVTIDRGQIGDGGIAADADFTNVKLYHGSYSPANQLGGTLTLNTTTHTVTFTNLNWTVNAGGSDTLIVTGSLINAARVGNVMMLGLRAATSVVLDDTTQTVSGTFPSFGSKVSPATQSVGTATIQMLTTPGAANLISGSTSQPLATLRYTPTNEDFHLLSVKFTNAGTGLPSDISNLKLQYGSVVLSTVASMASNNTVSMTLTAPNNENLIKAGTSRDFVLYGDIAGGINVARTFEYEVAQAADVSSQGVTSGGLVTVTAAAVNDCQGNQTFPNQGCIQTISQGSLTTAISPAYNPSAGNIVVGGSKRIMTAVRFSASNNEAVNVTQVTVTRTNVLNSVDTDLSSIYLATVNANGSVGATLANGSLSGGTVQFGSYTINAFSPTYLLQVPKGGIYDAYILADIPTSATAAHQFHLDIAAAANVKADGVSSMNNLPAASVTGTATGNTMTLTATGVSTVGLSSTTAAATYVKGSTNNEFARYTFTADSGEDQTLSALKITFTSDGAGTALTTANTPTNVRVYKNSVVAANLMGTVASPSSGVANFSFTDTIKAGTSTVYIVVADLPTTNSAAAVYAEIKLASTDTTITGVSSGATISPGAVEYAGNKMTVGAGQLGVIMSSLPVYTNITSKTNGAEVARIVLTSGVNGETVNVTSLKVTLLGAASHGTNMSIDSPALSNITLSDISGGCIIAGTAPACQTSTVGTLTNNAATFSGLQIQIPTGTQRVISVKVNIGSPADAAPVNVVMGINNYYTDIAASGMSSLSTIYANQLIHSGSLVTLGAALATTGTDLHANVFSAAGALIADQLSNANYTLPALGITSVSAGDIIEIETDDMIVSSAAASTAGNIGGTRVGMFGTTAAAHNTLGVPVILKTTGTSAANDTTDSATQYIFGASVSSKVRVGEVVSQYDADQATLAAANNLAADLRLITAINAAGTTLTITDAYSGAAHTGDAGGDDEFVVPMNNYGQAQVVQSRGTLTIAVDSGTALAGQVVAGTSDVQFSRINLTSQYETIDVTKLIFTRTGGAQTSDSLGGGSDADFASVYLINHTNPTWGPNGNGKSNLVQLSGGTATFNFSGANAIQVNPNNSNGVSIGIRGNLNTVATGVGSGDAPKFYISSLGASPTQVTANGDSTGLALTTVAAGTPNPTTATNFNAQTIYKGLLTVALDSASLSGNQTRASNQTFLTLDMSSAATGSVATFRQAAINQAQGVTNGLTTAFTGAYTDTTTWTKVQVGTTVTPSQDATNFVYGSGSQRVTFTTAPANGDGIDATWTARDLSGYSGVGFWLRPHETGATNYTVTLDSAVAGSDTVTAASVPNDTWTFIDVPFTGATTPFTGITAVTGWRIVAASVAPTAGDYVDIGGLIFYKDKVVVNLASNATLTAGTGASPTATNGPTTVTLQQGATVLATAYASPNAGSTSADTVTFFPTSQFTIPTTGSVLSVVSDTTKLITASGSKTLSSTISLGSADNNGSTTAGNIWWHDGSFALSNSSIRWIYGTVSSISSGTITY